MDQAFDLARFRTLLRLSALCVFLAVATMILEMFLTALPDGARVQRDVAGWFELFERNPLMGMRNLGLINIVASTLMLPVFYALYLMHRSSDRSLSGLALLILVSGYSVFMADNTAFPFLDLSRQLQGASEADRAGILAAGRALLARGVSHAPGTFSGFVLIDLASILMCLAMQRGGHFGRIIGIVGIFAFSIFLVFEVVSAFVPSLYAAAMGLAFLGGVSALVWYLMTGIRIFRLSLPPREAARKV